MLELIAAFADGKCVRSVEAWTLSPRIEILEISFELQSSTGIRKIVLRTVDQIIEVSLEEIWYCEASGDSRLLVISLDLKKEVCCKYLDALSYILIFLCVGVEAPLRTVFYPKIASLWFGGRLSRRADFDWH